MIKAWVIRKKYLMFAMGIAILLLAVIVYLNRESIHITMGQATTERTIHMVTGEFKSTSGGKEIEAYRWDPGTIVVQKGEKINLSIYGVNGESHPFIIEGLNVKGEVKKGKETIVTFIPEKEGTYRIICLTHPDIAHHGPMIGYIVVD